MKNIEQVHEELVSKPDSVEELLRRLQAFGRIGSFLADHKIDDNPLTSGAGFGIDVMSAWAAINILEVLPETVLATLSEEYRAIDADTLKQVRTNVEEAMLDLTLAGLAVIAENTEFWKE